MGDGSVGGMQTIRTGGSGTFTASVPAAAADTVEFDVSYAGDATHGPASAGCSTEVPSPPVQVLPPPTERPKETPPVTTSLSLTCRSPLSGEFTGMLAPALGGEPVTITYEYRIVGGLPQEKVDTVTTAGDGSFHDGGPASGAMGKATASWPGAPGYAGATSPACEFG
jgi:hypothetical protein